MPSPLLITPEQKNEVDQYLSDHDIAEGRDYYIETNIAVSLNGLSEVTRYHWFCFQKAEHAATLKLFL